MNSVFDSRILNLVVWSPAVFALLVMFLPKGEKGQIRTATLVGMLLNGAFAALSFHRFHTPVPEFQQEYLAAWLPEIGLSYHLGIDGIAATLVLMTGVLGPLVVMASWRFIDERVKEFHLALLVLQTAMMGALCSLDLLLFYVFFEAMLVPMYFLIGVWGSEERQMASMKFFLYTLVGSLLMLVALLGVYFIANPAGQRTFDYAGIYNGLLAASHEVSACVKNGNENCVLGASGVALLRYGPWFFAAFALAFAIKVPMFPVHTWLPDAHTQAPVAGSMILAAVMLKMGTFGFWRFALPLFPAAGQRFQTVVSSLAVVGIVYGALMCLAQRDIKRLIAYSSVSHLGYCMLGMMSFTPEGASGAAYQMLNHGVSTGALFLLFGMLYERRHVRLMSDYGGLAKVMPLYTAFFLIITFSSVAVPGTNGFVGEFLVLLGSFKSTLPLGLSVAATTAVVLGAAYMLWMVQKVFFGPITRPENAALKDIGLRELATALPFIALVFVMGLRPQPLLDVINASSERFVTRSTYTTDTANAAVRMAVLQLPPAAVPGAVPARPTITAAPPNINPGVVDRLRNLRAPGSMPTVRLPGNAVMMPAPQGTAP